jgi:hypothetical protein
MLSSPTCVDASVEDGGYAALRSPVLRPPDMKFESDGVGSRASGAASRVASCAACCSRGLEVS